MNVILLNQIPNYPVPQDIVAVDENQRVTITDTSRAMNILLNSDANSAEYRIIQVAMQMVNIQEQNALRTDIDLREREIVRLNNENRRLSDEVTTIQIKEDSNQLRSAERREGILTLLLTLPAAFFFPPALIAGPYWGIGKLCRPGSDEMRAREAQMELYRTFNPDTSLTEVYNYVKQNPLKYTPNQYNRYIDDFRINNPTGTYTEFVNYITSRLPRPTRDEIEYTGKGPTGFQTVKKCDCPNCQ